MQVRVILMEFRFGSDRVFEWNANNCKLTNDSHLLLICQKTTIPDSIPPGFLLSL
jgi:hypothetical protein